MIRMPASDYGKKASVRELTPSRCSRANSHWWRV